MGFKNMKRDDHGHVISNDETDGQKCKHQGGGNSRPSIDYDEIERRKNDPRFQKDKMAETPEEVAAYLREKGGELLDFDDDYDEEFDAWDREHMNTDKEPDARPNHTKLNDMLKAMPDDDIGDMMRINGLDDEFEDESQEEYEARIKPEAEKFKKQLDDAGYKLKENEYGIEKADKYSDFIGKDGQVKPGMRKERDNFINQKWNEATKIIEDAGMKDVALSYAGQLKNDYIEGKITKDELVDKYREHFKNQRDIVGDKYNDADKGIQNQINNAVNHFKQDYFLSNNSDEDVARVAKGMGYNAKPIGERMANGAQKYQISKNDKAQPNRSDEDKAARQKKDPVAKIGDRNLKLSEFVNMAGKADKDLQDVLATIIASNYGLSEADAEKMIVDKYYELHDHNGKFKGK